VALLLKRSGARWVHPLHGGLAGWIDAGFPLEALPLADAAERAS
jgi:3-mercaptopyruvate sulfurtransferase SseA